MLALKEQGSVGAVVVAGCLAERKKETLLEEVPEVDQIVGVFGREEIAPVVDRGRRRIAHEQRSLFRPAPVQAQDDTRPAADHAAALRLSQDLRGLRPTLHLLRHPRHARQARHQADRGSHRARPANWPPTASAS